jgi:D-alanyl-D-alanine carboxypeptidase/D-alanyl-D-alanine-endopeptidase (penicillin-binding protein 4)
MIQKTGWGCLLIIALAGACTPNKYLTNSFRQTEKDFHDHVGFVLYDPAANKTIFDHQGERYFTPASNTKIFTLYASLKLLGDSIPALRYVTSNDSLTFWGTGHPGFLYEDTWQDSVVYNFLKGRPERLFFSSSNFQTDAFGPGWSWDDYMYYFQVERTSLPVYGNLAKVKKFGNAFLADPPVFDFAINSVAPPGKTSTIVRGKESNLLTYTQGVVDRPKQWEIPFHVTDDIVTRLLKDTLMKDVTAFNKNLPPYAHTLYAPTPDSLYKVMMVESDNFIAEQLLLVCAGVVSDTLKPEIAIRHVKKNFLADLPDEPVWVDGSGLSRYNLFTPRSIVALWAKIDTMVPRDRLFQLLAVGGRNGTLKNYYKAEKPYIFGKTGTLSNNHALSGYLVTKQGHTLIFSWMNNNFVSTNADVRRKMEEVLTWIYEKY